MADSQKPPAGGSGGSPSPDDDLILNPSADEFFKRLQPDMRRPQPSQDAIATAFQAMQRLAAESSAADGVDETSMGANQLYSSVPCASCGHANRPGNQFCGMCGLPLEPSPGASLSSAPQPFEAGAPGVLPEGFHHYHHHYHHHHFGPGAEQFGVAARSLPGESAPRDSARPKGPGSGQVMSRAETAVRKVTQDWTVACNSRQLDDLVSTYSTDAMILRPNHPAVRGSAAIREFFFSALESGLGEVELEILRVDVVGDVAYEAGRCKMLVPVAVGKRREERGKYLTVLGRQSNGEWRIVIDCWSSDLNLSPGVDVEPGKAAPAPSTAQRPPVPRKTT